MSLEAKGPQPVILCERLSIGQAHAESVLVPVCKGEAGWEDARHRSPPIGPALVDWP